MDKRRKSVICNDYEDDNPNNEYINTNLETAKIIMNLMRNPMRTRSFVQESSLLIG